MKKKKRKKAKGLLIVRGRSGTHHTKAYVGAAELGSIPVAEGRAASYRVEAIGAAAHNTILSAGRSNRIGLDYTLIVSIPVITQFPNIAVHVHI